MNYRRPPEPFFGGFEDDFWANLDDNEDDFWPNFDDDEDDFWPNFDDDEAETSSAAPLE